MSGTSLKLFPVHHNHLTLKQNLVVNTIKCLAEIQEQRIYNNTSLYVIQVLQEMQNGLSSRLFCTKYRNITITLFLYFKSICYTNLILLKTVTIIQILNLPFPYLVGMTNKRQNISI